MNWTWWEWIQNHNFFDRPTFIRKIQCNVFGHEWFGWAREKRGGYYWCSWCARKTTAMPKMRARPLRK